MEASQPQTPHWLAARWLPPIAAVVLLALLFGRGMMRCFDMDEHQFVAPGLFLAQDGSLPYRDYPYFHMPLLVYLYGGLATLFQYKLVAARTVSVLCSWAIVLLLARAGSQALAQRPPRTRRLMIGAVLLAYICCQLFTYTSGWAWNHDSATLCALAAFLLQLRGLKKAQVWPIAVAGALAGLAMGIRLSFALIVLPMSLMLFFGQSTLTTRRRALALTLAASAAAAVLLPALLAWSNNPDAFLFGNLGYAGLSTRDYARRHEGYHTLPGKVLSLFLKFFADPGNAFLFLAAAYSLGYAYWKQRGWRSPLANEFGLVLGFLPALLVGAWGPSPVQQQYYYMLLPFLVLAGFYAMALDCATPRLFVRWRRILVLGAAIPAVVGLARWYWPVIYLPFPEAWTAVRVAQVGQWIKSQCPPNARVLTADPLFALEGGLNAYQEYAVGRFILHVGDLMKPEDRKRFHVAWGEELDRVLAERPPEAVFWHTSSPSEPLMRYAAKHGFRKLDHQMPYHDVDIDRPPERFELWIRPPGPILAASPLAPEEPLQYPANHVATGITEMQNSH